MNRIFRPISLLLILGMFASPATLEARGRQNPGGGVENSAPSRSPSGNNNRPGTNNRPTNNGGGFNNGGNSGNRPGTNNRPNNNGGGFNGGNSGKRPGTNNRPNNNGGGFNGGGPAFGGNSIRPGNPRPGNIRPNGPQHYRPDYYRPRYAAPLMPMNRPFGRPTPPPPGYRYGRAPLFNTLFGLTLGTAINLSLNYLIDWGYNVAGYANDAIYLTNVSQLGYVWPDATIYYNNSGCMYGSQLVYSTPQFDLTRYNTIYNTLLTQYGNPVSSTNDNGSVSATWWGNNEYVTLRYYPDYANNGTLRYFTTLSCGQ
jgi:hypothetical protein